ncbi:MAG: DNA polymerase III subunit delta [Candidatus Omnitrophica bacterium]|nr:DNA polymerase III subunit delta [Candidatus Omnitrophota bacterium]
MPSTAPSQIPLVIALLGPDRRLKQERLDLLKQELGITETDYHRYEAPGCDWGEVCATLRAAPFLAPRRLVVLEGLEYLTETQVEAVRAYLAAPAGQSCLVLWSEAKAEKLSWLRGLDGVRVETCEPLKAAALERWITARVQTLGKRIGPEALARLIEWSQEEPGRAAGTVDQLCAYVGDRPAIEAADVQRLCPGPSPTDLFRLLEALARHDLPQALRIVTDHGAPDQRSLLRLVGLLIYQATQLWQVESAVAAGQSWEAACEQARVFRTRQDAVRRAARALPLPMLTALLEALWRLERGVKQGEINSPLAAFETIIVRFGASPVGA